MTHLSLRCLLALAMLFALPGSAHGQVPSQAPMPPAQRVAAAEQLIAQALIGFARTAESYKQPSRARQVYEQILDHYDIENPTARKGLGWKQAKGEWQAPTAGALSPDAATPDQKKKVEEAWRITARKVAKLHRELGVALMASNEDVIGRSQLERALTFDPDDTECHQALGHEQIDGFYGTAEQLVFVRRMRDMLAKARELRSQEFECTDLGQDKLPGPLERTGLQFFGARSKHFEQWVVDSAEDARLNLVWSERSVAFAEFLLGPEKAHLVRTNGVKWFGLVRDDAQRDLILERAPVVRGKYSLEEAKLFGGLSFTSPRGQATMNWHHRDNDADHSVAAVTKHCLIGGRNEGLGEGLVHATTWLLCGSTITYFCDLPKTFSGSAKLMPRDPKAWLARLQQEIDQGTDYPLVQLARERSDNFHESARIKSWSFMLWLVARYPDRWIKLLDKLTEPNMMPEDVTKVFATVMERSLGDIEEEWRAWARRGSRIGKASGFVE